MNNETDITQIQYPAAILPDNITINESKPVSVIVDDVIIATYNHGDEILIPDPAS